MIGSRLEGLRKMNSMTQAEVAKELSVVPNTISQYELGISTPDDTNKIKLSRIFGVSVDYLVGATDDPTPYPMPDQSMVILLDHLSPAEVEEIKKFLTRFRHN